ncbi:unnamed protein product [Merluccius merluccius]
MLTLTRRSRWWSVALALLVAAVRTGTGTGTGSHGTGSQGTGSQRPAEPLSKANSIKSALLEEAPTPEETANRTAAAAAVHSAGAPKKHSILTQVGPCFTEKVYQRMGLYPARGPSAGLNPTTLAYYPL